MRSIKVGDDASYDEDTADTMKQIQIRYRYSSSQGPSFTLKLKGDHSYRLANSHDQQILILIVILIDTIKAEIKNKAY